MHQWPFAPISESCFPSKGGVALQDIFFWWISPTNPSDCLCFCQGFIIGSSFPFEHHCRNRWNLVWDLLRYRFWMAFFWRAIEYWVDGDLYEFINLKSSATIGIATPATNFHHCSDGEGDEETWSKVTKWNPHECARCHHFVCLVLYAYDPYLYSGIWMFFTADLRVSH